MFADPTVGLLLVLNTSTLLSPQRWGALLHSTVSTLVTRDVVSLFDFVSLSLSPHSLISVAGPKGKKAKCLSKLIRSVNKSQKETQKAPLRLRTKSSTKSSAPLSHVLGHEPSSWQLVGRDTAWSNVKLASQGCIHQWRGRARGWRGCRRRRRTGVEHCLHSREHSGCPRGDMLVKRMWRQSPEPHPHGRLVQLLRSIDRRPAPLIDDGKLESSRVREERTARPDDR